MLCQSFFGAVVVPTLLFCIALHRFKALNLIYKTNKKIHPTVFFIFVFTISLGSCLNAKATTVTTFPTLTFQRPQMVDTSKQLTQIFALYKANEYEDIPEITQRSCAIENRFTYILASLNKIEETNLNIHRRHANLEKRKRHLVRNFNKINIRETNAQMTLLLPDIPEVNIQEIDLNNTYKRITLYGNEISKNISNLTCSKHCAFNHIDQSSIAIVYEIDEIQEQQNQVNSHLSVLEGIFERLEKIQRSEEKKLTQAGF